MKKVCAISWILLCLIFQSTTVHSQSSLSGKVTGKNTGEEMLYAKIIIKKDGVFITGTFTDFEGNYFVKLDPGSYDIEVVNIGYQNNKFENVRIKKGQAKIKNLKIEDGYGFPGCVITIGYKIPLIQQDETTTGQIISSDQIKHQPTRDIYEISTLATGVSFNH